MNEIAPELTAALAMRDAALRSVESANMQLEVMYLDVQGALTAEQKAKWLLLIGRPLPLSDSLAQAFDLGMAKRVLDNGGKVARSGWNGKNMWLKKQNYDKLGGMTLPYVYMRTAQGDLVPWLCSQTDFFADDWVIVP